MPKITLADIEKKYKVSDYNELVNKVNFLISKGKLRPVKADGINGKTPALYVSYREIEESKDYSKLEEELKFRILPPIKTDYYLSHLAQYEKERREVLQLNDFFSCHSGDTHLSLVSANERSFEIWQREKFLLQGGGRTLLKHCGIKKEALCLYETSEPLAYYTRSRRVPQNILILENKDPFYGMRRYISTCGNNEILGMEFDTLIYGAGKGILRSFMDYRMAVEPYMTDSKNRLFYFGDLDHEGIGIYEGLAEKFLKDAKIELFVPAYLAMIKKAERMAEGRDLVGFLPLSKEGQVQKMTGTFESFFDRDTMGKISYILENGRYIPQEILNEGDYSAFAKQEH